MKGYKVFKPDWTCRGFQYAVGKVFEEDAVPSCCEQGFHFCKELKDCFNYYQFNPENKVAEIEALGDIDTQEENSKCCTNKIKIVREISWKEVLKMVNEGICNTGFCNRGDLNSGHYNKGNYNSGIGNSGNHNSGNYNSGNYNSGNYNQGEWNSGDWNRTSFSNGCFNTEIPKIMMFNKPSNWTFKDWWNSEARKLLNTIPNNTIVWAWPLGMTDEEKERYPNYKTTNGYLKELGKSECSQKWWNKLSDVEKDIIKTLPNFDADIFKEITGIDVNKT